VDYLVAKIPTKINNPTVLSHILARTVIEEKSLSNPRAWMDMDSIRVNPQQACSFLRGSESLPKQGRMELDYSPGRKMKLSGSPLSATPPGERGRRGGGRARTQEDPAPLEELMVRNADIDSTEHRRGGL
jgi:hypothetical protein